MRIILCLIALAFFTACSHNGEPSATQIEFALNKAVKARNPNASAKVTSVECKSPYFDEAFKFTCTNCVIQHGTEPQHILPAGEGHGVVRPDRVTQKWKFERIILESKELGLEVYESDYVF